MTYRVQWFVQGHIVVNMINETEFQVPVWYRVGLSKTVVYIWITQKVCLNEFLSATPIDWFSASEMGPRWTFPTSSQVTVTQLRHWSHSEQPILTNIGFNLVVAHYNSYFLSHLSFLNHVLLSLTLKKLIVCSFIVRTKWKIG